MKLGTTKLIEIAWDAAHCVVAEGALTKKQIQASPIGEALLGHWSLLDANSDGNVDKKEFAKFVLLLEQIGMDKAWLANVLYYADVGVMQHVATEVTKRRMELSAIEVLSVETLLARVWRTLDGDCNLNVSKKELTCSCFGELMSDWWHMMDGDTDNHVSVEEWNDFWKGRESEWGSGKLRKVVSSLVYEADVDVSDLVNKNVERTTDLDAKHEIAQVTHIEMERQQLFYFEKVLHERVHKQTLSGSKK